MQKNLPRDWKLVSLGDVCEVVSGFGFPLEHQGNSNQEIPFYKVSDMNLPGNEKEMINHNNSLSKEEVTALKYKLYPSNTIIFPKIGAAIATNKKRLLTKQSIFDNNVMGLIPSDYVMFSYLYYWMQGFNISSWASDSQPPSIRKSTVENYEIPLPPLHIQHKIVEILEEADNLRKFRQQADEKMKNLIPSLFVQMFGDPATNPKGWPTRSLGGLCDVRGGGTPPKAKPEYWIGDIPWVSPKDMGGSFIADSQDHISNSAIDKSATNLIPKGALLIVTRSGILRHTLPLSLTLKPVAINQDIKAFIPGDGVNPFFLFAQLKNRTTEILQLVRIGATVQNIETETLKKTKIMLPPKPIQQEFAHLAEKVETEKAHQVESKKKLDELFNSLMQRAFTGELVA